jgi:mRNA interferase MazF
VAVCPITSTKRDYFIKLDDEVNRQVTGYINALQLKTLDFRVRDARFVEKATTYELGRTTQMVKMIFNFSNLLGE